MASIPHAGWFHDGRTACVLLTVGSLMLLGAAASVEVLGGLLFIPLTFGGWLLHILGWVALNEVSRQTRVMRAAFVLSLVGFAFGVIAFLVVVPSAAGVLLFAGWLFVPHSPYAYVPVVLAHGVLFLAVPPTSAGRSPLIVAGGLFLIAFAIATPTVLLAVPSYHGIFQGSSLVSLAGLSSAGYGMAAVGFREAARVRGPTLERSGAAEGA